MPNVKGNGKATMGTIESKSAVQLVIKMNEQLYNDDKCHH
jgi:hypothetical protein